MVGYLALQVIKGNLTYRQVVQIFPQYKESIDQILEFRGKADLIQR